jgi:hypothetical protein
MRRRERKMTNSTTTCQGTDALGVTSQNCVTIYGQSTSTDPLFYNGFSAGEIMIVTFLFLNFSVLCVITYHLLFRRIKIKNQ